MKDNLIPRVFTVEMRQDDPAKCTSAKMRRLGLARRISKNQIPPQAVVLNPSARSVLLNSDSAALLSGGLVVIDCSWNRAKDVFDSKFKGIQRKLPALLAGNPTNYAVLGSLSSVEAVSAALYITDLKNQAKNYLAIFKWGETFLTLNQEVLEEYSKAETSERVREIEVSYFPYLA
jgi:pre-rRNA-processing protein TSR3